MSAHRHPVLISLAALLITLIILNCSQNNLPSSFASPHFIRQEITDPPFDKIMLHSNRTNSTGPADLVSVTYLSDGKTLNATLWLNNNLPLYEINPAEIFGMYIDVDLDNATGINGTDYLVTMHWDPLSSTWVRQVIQTSSPNYDQMILVNDSNTGYHEHQIRHVPLYLKLSQINYPDKYRIAFFARDRDSYDYTPLVYVPQPRFALTIPDSQVILSQGSNNSVLLRINSSSGFQPTITLSTEKMNGIDTSFSPNDLVVPPYGIAMSKLNIHANTGSGLGDRDLIIIAKAKFPGQYLHVPWQFSNNKQVKPTSMALPAKAQPTIPIKEITQEYLLSLKLQLPPTWLEKLYTGYTSTISTLTSVTAGIVALTVSITGILTFITTHLHHKRKAK